MLSNSCVNKQVCTNELSVNEHTLRIEVKGLVLRSSILCWWWCVGCLGWGEEILAGEAHDHSQSPNVQAIENHQRSWFPWWVYMYSHKCLFRGLSQNCTVYVYISLRYVNLKCLRSTGHPWKFILEILLVLFASVAEKDTCEHSASGTYKRWW